MTLASPFLTRAPLLAPALLLLAGCSASPPNRNPALRCRAGRRDRTMPARRRTSWPRQIVRICSPPKVSAKPAPWW